MVGVAGLGGILAGLYAGWARPRMLRWGATADEVAAAFPGAAIVPGGVRSATMATTLDAPPEQVWPWLVQMGHDRAGWYSWDGLDNFGRRSAWSLHPEWQQVGVGDRLVAKPDGTQWWEVAAFEPPRFLALRMSLDLQGRPFDPAGRPPARYTDSTWGFLLSERPGGRTRLVVSGYWAFRPGWLRPILSVTLLEPSHWIMQTRQFTNLQRRVRPASRPVAQPRRDHHRPPGRSGVRRGGRRADRTPLQPPDPQRRTADPGTARGRYPLPRRSGDGRAGRPR